MSNWVVSLLLQRWDILSKALNIKCLILSDRDLVERYVTVSGTLGKKLKKTYFTTKQIT